MEVLKEMRQLIDSYTDYLNHTQEKLKEIKEKINEYNYPDKNELYKKLFILFNAMPRNPINHITSLIQETIYDTCNHEWIHDDIDLSPEISQHIIYCEHCLMNYQENN